MPTMTWPTSSIRLLPLTVTAMVGGVELSVFAMVRAATSGFVVTNLVTGSAEHIYDILYSARARLRT